MTLRAALLVVATALPLTAAACPEIRPLVVHLAVNTQVDPTALTSGRQEAAWILRSLCAAIQWSEVELADGLLIRVLSAPLTTDPTPDALGFAMPNIGRGDRGAVFLSRIQEKVEASGGRVSLPILLGTVIAHEIGHLLLGTTTHSAEGIMRADFGKVELEKAAQRHLVFTAADRAAFSRRRRRALLVLNGASAPARAQPNSPYQFRTTKYTIEMLVSFPAAYEGRRLAVYRTSDPSKEVCLSIHGDTSACTEMFVGALALVTFLVKQAADGKVAATSIRERVTLIDQTPGLPDRPPFDMSVRLVNGAGSDVQVFGYDENPLPQERRAAEREAAKAAWRCFRQELYMDNDRNPFAVIEWLHTSAGIRILRVDGSSPPARKER
jgi:hypothetical protein